jgi:mono/diheme cytochrome c family protein
VQPIQFNRRLRPLGILVVIVILVVAVLTAINLSNNWRTTAAAKKLKNPVPPTEDAIAAGKQAYGEHCRNCHGDKGDGKGKKAAELSVAPGDFTDAPAMARRTDGELFWQITRGRLPMPAFEDKLSDQERWQLVDYIRTFANKSSAAPSGDSLTSVFPAPRKLPSCPARWECRSF